VVGIASVLNLSGFVMNLGII
jgi:hypothetical protein